MSCTKISYNASTKNLITITDEITLTFNDLIPSNQLLQQEFPEDDPKYNITLELNQRGAHICLVTTKWCKLYRAELTMFINGEIKPFTSSLSNEWKLSWVITENPMCLVLRCAVHFEQTLMARDLPFWEEKTPTLGEDLAGMLEGDGDVLLTVQGEKIHAHRVILAARSTVFRAMFSGKNKESETGVVNIQDLAPETIRALVAFAYSDTLPQQVSPELILAAEKYDMPRLKNLAIRHFLHGDNFLPSIAVDLFSIAFGLSWLSLQQQVVLKITPKTLSQVQASASWIEAPDGVKVSFLNHYLRSNKLKSK